MLSSTVIVMVIAVHIFFTKPLFASDSKEVTIPVQGYIGIGNPEAYSHTKTGDIASGNTPSSHVQAGDTTTRDLHFILMLVSCILFIYILNWNREEEAKYNVF
jgi:hypothetical protein